MMGSNKSGLVGNSVTRVEDDRLLIGAGRYVADINPEGVLHAAFLRSPLAHADITSIDVSAALRAPGVVAVYTGEDMERLTHPFPVTFMLPTLYTPLYYALSSGRVRHVGDPIAMVLAESRHLAEDALELIEVEFAQRTPVANIADALAESHDHLWDKAGSNLLMDHTQSIGPVDAVFAAADRVITERLSSHRQSNQPMETRGSVIEVDPITGQLTIYSSTQSSHLLRWMTAALTGKETLRATAKKMVKRKDRLSAFGSAAKQFMADNSADMKGQDSSGPKSQFKRDKSFVKHMNLMTLGLLAKDNYPDREGPRHRWRVRFQRCRRS